MNVICHQSICIYMYYDDCDLVTAVTVDTYIDTHTCISK
jgi:hypothetical protein